MRSNLRRHLASRHVAATCALLATAATLTACGGTTKTADLPTSIEELVAQAKDEGEVNWASWNPEDQMQPAIDLFEEKYPGIQVNYSNVKAPEQISQIQVEQQARKVSIDVANAGGLTVAPATKLAGDVDWSAYGVDDEYVFEDDFVYVWATPKVWAYNTDKVKPEDVPHTWDDLLEQKWAGGQISAESRGSFMTVWDLDESLGDEAGLDWASSFAKLDPHYSPSLTQAAAPVESGEVSVGTSLINLVLAAKDRGAPVEVAPVSPTSANESYLYVPDGAQHPAAAVLLTSFLSSDEAQQVLAKSYNSRIPVDTDCSGDAQGAVVEAMCQAHLEWYGAESIKTYQDLAQFYPDVEKALGTNVS
ncbi:MAG: extracellular solute-binding protein [Actinomycetota bacterium]|nr:extracellular solute-binding protein [Actinomycetota bacterium]